MMGGESIKRRGWLKAAILATSVMATTLGTGCRVSDTDVRRWEGTERGPFKLVAVVTHDKYVWALRTEAALSLIRMPARGGQRKGIAFLCDRYKDEDGEVREGALASLSEETRRQIVNGMAPELIRQMQEAPPPRTADGRLPPDPTIPFKDATFAMLVHEPSLVGDEKTKADLMAALTQWAQTGFEDRIENGSQQYGMEQMMRFLGAASVRALPGLINENAARLDRMAGLVADIGDEDTKRKASEALAVLAKKYLSPDWLAAQTVIVKKHNADSGAKTDDAGVAKQVATMLDRRLNEEVFPAMKKVGGRASVDFLIGFASDTKNTEERRKTALAALEGRVDKNNASDLDRIFAIAKADDTPDTVRDGAFQRFAEFPKEQIVPKLYSLFEPKKWKIRSVAASLVLKTMSTKGVPEFMHHLPATPATKMGKDEPLLYGPLIAKMEPAAGDPKPRDVVTPFLTAHEIGPRLVAIGSFYEGKKADAALLRPFEDDKAPLPKCEKEDECAWTWDVPKAPGSKETESKPLVTVGDFVKYCVIPSMEK